ncbi:PadR family transcriptional regulator [Nocardioides zeae]|uniref:PadR family transcriptional regulator n=1 Tax=Nocardioides imazamoxiresistens TaxID=3231893 RepID=A0ABU3PV25_9ACTN|nr:PadR family transcriptional regulator [Nocardioides zeae]MDT9593075.1 PadR family transcriptional regulator [Nocardioides zeae]
MWDKYDDNDETNDDERRGRGPRRDPSDWSSLGEAIGGGFAAGFGPGRRPHPGGRGGGRARRGQPVPPWVADMLGFDAPPQRGRGGGPKVRRGDVRSAILDVLAAEPRNGYQVISEIAERSHGEWKPSPGSVYPTIQQLEDEGLVVADESLGRRALRLTDEGRAYVEEHADEIAAVWAPFAPREEDGPQGALPEIGQVMNALWQIVATGTDAQRREALTVLADTRRRLYGILAEGER